MTRHPVSLDSVIASLESQVSDIATHLKALRRERANRRRRLAWADPAKRAAHGDAVSHGRIVGNPAFVGMKPKQIAAYREFRNKGLRRPEAIEAARSVR